jgi:hypothetical protein
VKSLSSLDAKIEQAKAQLIGLELEKLGLDAETANRVNQTITALRQESDKMTQSFKEAFQPLLDKKPEQLTETDTKVLSVIAASAEATLAETARGFALGSEHTAAHILLSAACTVDRGLRLMPLEDQENEDQRVPQVSPENKNLKRIIG